MTAPSESPAYVPEAGGVARAHRGIALLFLVLGLVAFFLAGLGTFGEGFDAHRIVGSLMVLLALILLILAAAGRKQALQASVILFGLMILQQALAILGSEASAWIGALHPVNGLVVLGVASLVAAGRPVAMPRRSAA